MRAFGLSLLLFLSACAHSIHEVHTSDFTPGVPIESGNMVKAQSEQFVIFWFANESNYVDEAYHKLMSACPSGALTGITTQLSTSLGFFSWTNKVLMQGLCVSSRPKG
jgi:uncharacterized Fe-S cluster protein YjdI